MRVLDLGAGAGEIAVEMALRRAAVTAVEGRAANAADARALARQHNADVEVIEADVRKLDWDALGSFDVVVCSGLLYHLQAGDALSLPRRMRGVCARLLLIDTEIAWGALEMHEKEQRSYAGLRFREHARGSTAAEREASRLASLDNEESFWLTRASLHALLHDAGFSSSWELGAPGQPRREGRVTVAAIPGEPVGALELAPGGALPDPRPLEPDPGRLGRARLALARLRKR
jgi:SAM-dependent methyltransferase